jgi:hypothetical protein
MVINMKIKYILLLLLLSLTGRLSAQEAELLCRIDYLSKENVYINKGANAGLAVGDTLTVTKNGKMAATLVIIHTSQHSASCRILDQPVALEVGDQARFVWKEEKSTAVSIIPVVADDAAIRTTNTKTVGKTWARISGGLSAQWYHTEDLSGNNLDFDQPTLRFDLKARELWGKNYNFIINMRVRKNERSRSFSTGIGQETFQNRIYSFYFSFDDPTAAFNYAIGRLHANELSGVGYLDGLFVKYNLSPRFYFGVYGGLKSSWQFAGAEQSRQKYGLVVGYRSDRSADSRIETSLAVNTEYNGKTISRENLYFQSSFIFNNRLFIYNSVDVDINREWRKEKSGEDLSLSALYLSARYRFSDLITAGLAFDDRKNYYTYETMEIPADYFDMADRYGLRADLDLNFPRNYTFAIQTGIRKQENNTYTTITGRAALRKSNLIIERLNAGINLSLYSNYFTEGWVPTVVISQNFLSGHSLSVTGGENYYRYLSLDQKRHNYWIRLNSQFYIYSGMYLTGYYGYNWGDDREGYNFLIEIGYRF